MIYLSFQVFHRLKRQQQQQPTVKRQNNFQSECGVGAAVRLKLSLGSGSSHPILWIKWNGNQRDVWHHKYKQLSSWVYISFYSKWSTQQHQLQINEILEKFSWCCFSNDGKFTRNPIWFSLVLFYFSICLFSFAENYPLRDSSAWQKISSSVHFVCGFLRKIVSPFSKGFVCHLIANLKLEKSIFLFWIVFASNQLSMKQLPIHKVSVCVCACLHVSVALYGQKYNLLNCLFVRRSLRKGFYFRELKQCRLLS